MQRSTLLGGLAMAALAATAAVANGGAENGVAVDAELRAISSRVDARTSTVMIEATEPVAYVTSQPDPLTVVVDLRNVMAGFLAAPLAPVPPVMGVDVEEATAPDGAPLARVVVRLDRPAPHKVHSSRNVIYIDVDRPEGLTGLKPAPAPVAAGRSTSTRTATAIQSVRALPDGSGIALRGDGALIASSIEEAKDLPHRVLLDFRMSARRACRPSPTSTPVRFSASASAPTAARRS
jgi:hypothetical protein